MKNVPWSDQKTLIRNAQWRFRSKKFQRPNVWLWHLKEVFVHSWLQKRSFEDIIVIHDISKDLFKQACRAFYQCASKSLTNLYIDCRFQYKFPTYFLDIKFCIVMKARKFIDLCIVFISKNISKNSSRIMRRLIFNIVHILLRLMNRLR